MVLILNGLGWNGLRNCFRVPAAGPGKGERKEDTASSMRRQWNGGSKPLNRIIQEHEPLLRKATGRERAIRKKPAARFPHAGKKNPRQVVLGKGMQKESKVSPALRGGLFLSPAPMIHDILPACISPVRVMRIWEDGRELASRSPQSFSFSGKEKRPRTSTIPGSRRSTETVAGSGPPARFAPSSSLPPVRPYRGWNS